MNFFRGINQTRKCKKHENFNEKELLRINDLKNELKFLKNLLNDETSKRRHVEEELKLIRSKNLNEIIENMNLKKSMKDLVEENEKIKQKIHSVVFENSVLKNQIGEFFEKVPNSIKEQDLEGNLTLSLLNKIENLEMKKDYGESKKMVLELEVRKTIVS